MVISGDLPPVEHVLLPIGVTLNNTGATGRDLLSDNLVLNGTFDLAKIPEWCAYDAEGKTVTTPNGYTCYFPAPFTLHGWKRMSTSVQYIAPDGDESGHVALYPTPSDSLPCALRQDGSTFSVKAGDTYSVSLDLSGKGAGLEVLLMSDSTKAVSSVYSAQPQESWRHVEGTISVTSPADSVYLVIRAVPMALADSVQVGKRGRTLSAVMVDNIRLSRGGAVVDKLRTILGNLSPEFVRFPSGRTANGFYPGTFPVWWRDSVERLTPESWPIWTLEQGEMTGEFCLDDFMNLTQKLRAIPILIDNSGFTDQNAMQRIEDIALLPKRIERIFGVADSHGHDSLILQLGYGISNPEYEKRFSMIAKEAKDKNLKASLTAAGSLLWNERKFSNNIVDYQIPAVSTPNIRHYIPSIYHQPEQAPEPIMLGEVHFEAPSDQSAFIPLFVLKAATLIDAEKNSNIIRGISLSPFLSEDENQVPMVLVNGADYARTSFFYFVRAFTMLRGEVLRQIPEENITGSGLVCSLTSDKKGENFYLKAANTTRHPLTFNLKIRGKNTNFSHMNIVRFFPKSSTTTKEKGDFSKYSISEERSNITLGTKSEITFNPFEVVIIHLSHASSDESYAPEAK